jgi:hypothetical protein
VSVAFRPEDARLTATAGGNCLAATVRRVEFRGPFCRVYLAPAGDDAGAFIVDTPLAEADGLLGGAEKTINVHLPPEHLRVFREDGSAL